MDEMSPNERAAAVNERIVANLADLPEDFRQRVIATGERLASQLQQRTA
jgi:hypothetical protein